MGSSTTQQAGVPLVLTTFLEHIGNDDQGATAVEYGLIIGLVVIAMAGALQAVADANTSQWETVSEEASAVMQGR